MNAINLKRPLVFFDLESTGLILQKIRSSSFVLSFLPDGAVTPCSEHVRPSIPISGSCRTGAWNKRGGSEVQMRF
jgi:hypothetical protein